jgi:hypothetical protein
MCKSLSLFPTILLLCFFISYDLHEAERDDAGAEDMEELAPFYRKKKKCLRPGFTWCVTFDCKTGMRNLDCSVVEWQKNIYQYNKYFKRSIE